MIVKTRHFGIIVKDIQVSTNFYSKILGLDMKSELLENGNYFNKLINLDNKEAKVIKINIPDSTYIELIQFINLSSSQKTELYNFDKVKQMHICFTVKEIDKFYLHLKSLNVTFISPPLKSDFDPVKTCFFYDPDFNYVQIVEDTK